MYTGDSANCRRGEGGTHDTDRLTPNIFNIAQDESVDGEDMVDDDSFHVLA